MPRASKRDLAVTKLLLENGRLQGGSFVSQPGADGKPHLYFGAADMIVQRSVVLHRDNYRCQLRYDGCTGVGIEVDHKQGGLVGRWDDLDNLQAVCPQCHVKKHGRYPRFGENRDEQAKEFAKLYREDKP